MATEGPNTWSSPEAEVSTPDALPTQPSQAPSPGFDAPPTYAHPPVPDGPMAGHGGRRLGKIRNPWGVWGLSIITVGIYYLYWWYKINEEVQEFDQSIEVQPVLAMLAMFVPFANFVTLFKTGDRIAQAERNAGNSSPCSGGLGLLLAFVFSMNIIYYQGHLNRLWEQHGGRPAA